LGFTEDVEVALTVEETALELALAVVDAAFVDDADELEAGLVEDGAVVEDAGLTEDDVDDDDVVVIAATELDGAELELEITDVEDD